MTTAKHQLGILLVHGIGTQPAGDTITRWGDVLVKTITQATKGSVAATVERAGKDLEGGDGERTEARLRLEHAGKAEHWLLSEGWWAESFLAPTYFELVSWSLRALPWALTSHIAQRYWLAKSGHTHKWFAATLALVKLFLGLLFAPVLVLALVVVAVVGLLPIPAVRGALLSAQRVFTATVGDSLVFVESPVRAALIKTRILEGLEGLQQRCDRTVVVAHSQGAAVALEALGGIAGVNEPPDKQPDTLITFGAGTNPLSILRTSEALPKKIVLDPVRLAMGASVLISAASTWLALQVTRGGLSMFRVLQAGLLWFLLGVVSVALGFGGMRLSRLLESRTPRLAKHARRISVSVGVGVAILGIVALYQQANPNQIPFASVLILGLALLLLGRSIYTILSESWERILTTVRCPPGLARWIDIYASLDPVPAGPTLIGDRQLIESHEIWNEGSIIRDHTVYWRNLDEFVLRVVRACAKAAASVWLAKLPAESDAIDQRARWRVSWLQMARTGFTTIAIALGVVLYHRNFDLMCKIAERIPNWIASRVAPTDLERGTLLVLIALGAVLAYMAVRGVWRWWVTREQSAILQHKSPDGIETLPLILIGCVLWVALLGAIALITGKNPVAGIMSVGLLQKVGESVLVVVAVVGLAAISTYVLKKLHRPSSEPGQRMTG
jgi:hypothetical protein